MIIKCEKCKSRFNLDEGLLKPEGSKVRCSVCKNIFTVFPPEQEPEEEATFEEDFSDLALEETVALDSPPSLEEKGQEPDEPAKKEDESFDMLFEEALEEDIEEGDTLGADTEDTDREERQEEQTEAFEESSVAGASRLKGAFSGGILGGSKTLLIGLIIICVLVVGGLVVFFLAPGILPDSLSSLKPVEQEDVSDTGTRRLTFEDVNGSFVQTSGLGQLFVIKGKVINDYRKSRSFILLKGTILDEEGNIIKQKLVYAGNVFTEDQLKNVTRDEMDGALKNQTGEENINVDVAPGDSVPFMITFDNLPDNLGEFVVEAVSSSPGN